MSNIIRKKTWPEEFEAILQGRKTYDLRLADFSVNEGDTLMLEECDPATNTYTGRTINKRIGFVAHTEDLSYWPKEQVMQHGYVLISLLNPRGTNI